MILAVTYSQAARQTLRNVCAHHEEDVVRRFGRAAVLEATEYGAFLALRLQRKHGQDVQVDRTRPFNEYADVSRRVRDAATAYEARERPSTPYHTFRGGTEHPTVEEMRATPLK